jgi:hypothetical protein
MERLCAKRITSGKAGEIWKNRERRQPNLDRMRRLMSDTVIPEARIVGYMLSVAQ